MNPFNLVADLVSPAMLGAFIPILLFMIPIVAILTGHQRRMAELMHGNGQSVDPRLAQEIDLMRPVLADMKILLHQQAIAIDNLAPALTQRSEISERLENVSK